MLVLFLLNDARQRHRHRLCVKIRFWISHDLAVVRALSDEIIVMHQGEVVEHGRAEQVFKAPQHPYTQSLVDAAFRFALRKPA